ncbi:unnamed protein product [Linum tenue]|uniref:Uncharacterized protein n=1 Tax=Linum tenue TaxID=586396 RepID=A0AAV0LDK2_9ROSI|nr:unnamed protein product [Linum tenue]
MEVKISQSSILVIYKLPAETLLTSDLSGPILCPVLGSITPLFIPNSRIRPIRLISLCASLITFLYSPVPQRLAHLRVKGNRQPRLTFKQGLKYHIVSTVRPEKPINRSKIGRWYLVV